MSMSELASTIIAFFFALIVLIYSRKLLMDWLGRPFQIITGCVGIPVHELSHAVAAILCGYRVKKVSLFNITETSIMGQVQHEYRRSIYSPVLNAFIGLAPLLGNLALAYFVWVIIFDVSISTNTIRFAFEDMASTNLGIVISSFFELHGWVGFLALYFIASLVLFAFPSKQDLQNAWLGVLLLLAVIALSVSVGLIDELRLVELLRWLTLVIGVALLWFASGLALIGLVLWLVRIPVFVLRNNASR